MTDILLAIGNPLASDDNAGLIVADLVETMAGDQWSVMSAYTVPENFVGQIRGIAPDLLVIVDAADMNLIPGTIRQVEPSRISDAGWGTHQSSLALLAAFLARFCKAILIIGIQIQSRDPGSRVSPLVQEAAEKLAGIIIERRWNELIIYPSS